MHRDFLSTSLADSLRARLDRRSLLRRGALLGLGATATGAILTACGGKESAQPTTAAPSASTTQATSAANPATTQAPASTVATTSGSPSLGTITPAKHSGGTLVEGSFADAKTMNPVLQSDTSSAAVIALMFNSVVRIDPNDAVPRGELAASWEISPDGLSYAFTLRDGVTWHDGTPLTARDVKFTYDLHANEASGSPRTTEIVERIASITVEDDKRFTVKLNFPAAPFLVNNMVYGIVPEHILKDVAPAALARHDFSTGKKGVTIGSGPFMFGEWVQSDHVTLEKYKGYWEGEPHLDRYVYKIVSNPTVLAQQIKTGEIDYTGPDGVDEADYQDLQRTKGVNVVAYDSFDFTFYAYQLDPTKSSLFLDKRVRQALFLALNRPQMIEAIRFGLGQVAIGTMGVDSWAYNPNAIALKYDFNQTSAKKLLDEAGWLPGSDGIRVKDGKRLAFKIYTNAGNNVREQYTAVLQQAWKQIGVEATPQVEEWTTLLDRITGHKDFDMYLIGLSWDPDPDQSSMWSTDAYQAGFNMNKYSNPKVDDLLKQGLLETDIGKRKGIYTDMQNIVVDDLPSAIIDFPKSIAAVSARVHNLFPNAIDDRFNAHQWWVDA